MILAALFLLAPGAAAPVETTEQQIVVLGEKLKVMRFSWSASDTTGAWRLKKCRIKKSSGDKDIDALTCRAVEACLSVMPLGAKQAPPEFSTCLSDKRRDGIADLAASRAAAMDAAP